MITIERANTKLTPELMKSISMALSYATSGASPPFRINPSDPHSSERVQSDSGSYLIGHVNCFLHLVSPSGTLGDPRLVDGWSTREIPVQMSGEAVRACIGSIQFVLREAESAPGHITAVSGDIATLKQALKKLETASQRMMTSIIPD